MPDKRENIKLINFHSIILFFIVLLGLLIHSGTFYASSENNRHDVSPYSSLIASLNHDNGVFSPGIRVQVFQKTWILNKDNFNLLAFNRNPLHENKITDRKIYNLQEIRKNSNKIPPYIFRCHLFSGEKDDPPLLS
jgi:hypothetical protein